MNSIEDKSKAEALYQKLSSSGSITEDTAKEYEAILELNPNHILALWNLGRIYNGEYDYPRYGSSWDEFNCANNERALFCFQRIIELDPKFSGAYHRLGKNFLGTN